MLDSLACWDNLTILPSGMDLQREMGRGRMEDSFRRGEMGALSCFNRDILFKSRYIYHFSRCSEIGLFHEAW
jgi:hypothetical protein